MTRHAARGPAWHVALFLACWTAPARGSAQQAPPDSALAPRWAFPGRSADLPATLPPPGSATLLRLPGSTRSFTRAQVTDQLHPPDWRPRSHPAAPPVVMDARVDVKYACGYCHLPDGGGRSENATLAGLPADYILRQVGAFRAGTRQSANPSPAVANMIGVARAATDSEVEAAARYFSRLRPRRRYRVEERETIPALYEASGLYAIRPGADSGRLAGRLLEVTESLGRHELRDPGERFVAYVPRGAVASGRRLAMAAPTDSAPRAACASCHGPHLRGAGLAPPIAGRSAAYLLRQLIGFRTGARGGPDAAPMRAVTSPLSIAQMVSLAAYVGSLAP